MARRPAALVATATVLVGLQPRRRRPDRRGGQRRRAAGRLGTRRGRAHRHARAPAARPPRDRGHGDLLPSRSRTPARASGFHTDDGASPWTSRTSLPTSSRPTRTRWTTPPSPRPWAPPGPGGRRERGAGGRAHRGRPDDVVVGGPRAHGPLPGGDGRRRLAGRGLRDLCRVGVAGAGGRLHPAAGVHRRPRQRTARPRSLPARLQGPAASSRAVGGKGVPPQPLAPKRSTRMSAAGMPRSTSSWLAASANPADPHT